MKENITENKLGTQPVGRLLFQLALPAIMAQVINALYNIVDRMYIGRIPQDGSLALAALGVAFPLIMIIAAFSALVGMGGAPKASIHMGAGKQEEAEKILGNSFVALILITLLLMVIFYTFQETLLTWFGATENTLPFAKDYFSIYLIGTIFVQFSLGLNPFIGAQGFAKISMMTVMIGAVSNIILDPIFIFGLHMGVKGAAIATVISQGISALWVIQFLFGKKSTIKIHRKYFKLEAKVILPVIALGVSPFIMQSTESLVQLTLNSGMKHYGGALADDYIGAMSIIVSCMQFILMPMMGLSQGAQPIISYNYGAGRMDRVKKAFRLLFISSVTFSTIVWLLVMLVPQLFVAIFSSDPQLTNISIYGLRIFMAGVLCMGAQTACQQTFVALGKARISVLLALLRKIILLIPLALTLPIFLGTTGIFIAEPISDICAATITTITFVIVWKRELRNK